MKVKDAIAAADAVKPNAFSEEAKFQWLRRLEGRLHNSRIAITAITI